MGLFTYFTKAADSKFFSFSGKELKPGFHWFTTKVKTHHRFTLRDHIISYNNVYTGSLECEVINHKYFIDNDILVHTIDEFNNMNQGDMIKLHEIDGKVVTFQEYIKNKYGIDGMKFDPSLSRNELIHIDEQLAKQVSDAESDGIYYGLAVYNVMRKRR